MLRWYAEAESQEKHTIGDPLPESTLTLRQSRFYPPVRDLGFGLTSKWHIIQYVYCVGLRIMTRSRVPDPWDQRHVYPSTHRSRAHVFNQCRGSGSACFWASRIRIRMYLGLLDPDPHVFGPPGSGSACFWASWIRIRMFLGLPDPHVFGPPGSWIR